LNSTGIVKKITPKEQSDPSRHVYCGSRLKKCVCEFVQKLPSLTSIAEKILAGIEKEPNNTAAHSSLLSIKALSLLENEALSYD
jgi:hypothetical protein